MRTAGPAVLPHDPRRRRARRTAGVLGAAFALAALLGAAPRAGADDPYAKTLAARGADLKSRSFHRRARAWLDLAETRDPRAIALFAATYARADAEPHVQALLVSTACDVFTFPADLAALTAWRDGTKRAGDAWLWYRVGLREVEDRGAAPALAHVRDAALATPLRAAALLALAAWADPATLAGIDALLATTPASAKDRGLAVGAAIRALRSQAGRFGRAEYARTARALVAVVDDPKAPDGLRVRLGRVLAHAAGLPRPLRSVAGWRLLLDGGAAPSEDDEGRTYAPPVTFMDVVATGRRIGFVIDASDSMKAPLMPEVVQDLKGPPASPTPRDRPGTPTTPDDASRPGDAPAGRRPAGGGGAAGGPSSADGLLDVRLRWNRIRTRYDAALEFVRSAAARLEDDVQFGACLFGTTTADLVRDRGLLVASKANLADLTRAVDVRMKGSGTLGITNLHGGILRMFRTDDRGLHPDAGYLDPDVAAGGVDTMYVLSDGAPCADDWWDGSERAMIAEGGWAGTYADADQLLDDVERWNLFRDVQIHTVSIGDDPIAGLHGHGGLDTSPDALLARLAARNGGTFRPVPRGARADPAAEVRYRPSPDAALFRALVDGLPDDVRARVMALLAPPTPAPAAAPPAPGGPPVPPAPPPPPALPTPPASGADDERVLPTTDAVALVRALFDRDERVRAAAAARLDALAGRRFAPGPAPRATERTTLLRTWAWWLDAHPPAQVPPAPTPLPATK